MRVRTFAALLQIAGLIACAGGEKWPTSPNPVTPPTITPPLTPYDLSGVVRADDGPVAGAKVAVLEQQPPSAVTTSENGSYSLSVGHAETYRVGVLVSASKPGYFSDIRFISGSALDFRLQPLEYIALGQVVRGTGRTAECSHWGYGSWPCHRFALTAPASGTLVVTASAPYVNFDIDVVGPNGEFVAYSPSTTGNSSVQAMARLEATRTYEIRIVTSMPDFIVTTELR